MPPHHVKVPGPRGWRGGLADLQEQIDTASCGEDKRVTVQGPVKKPQMDYMSHSVGGGGASS